MKRNKFLIVCAHPDDEILGCGGTAARLIKEGHEAHVLILGEGITSRDEKRDRDKRKDDIQQLKKQAVEANRVVGIKDVITCDYPDNRFDSVDLLDIVKTVEKTKERLKPDIIFTHYERDLNIDHQISYKAVLTATRPLPNETVKEIYSFEIPSSTEWNYPLTFFPDVFFDITDTLEIKLKAAEKYAGEMNRDNRARSPRGIRLTAKCWGIKTGLKYAEAFKVVRIIK